MEQDRPSIEILKEFAKSTERSIEFTENPHKSIIMHPVKLHRRSLYIPNDANQKSFFVCFGDSGAAANIGEQVLYSGVFIPVPFPKNSNVKIRKKNILDNFNIFYRKKFLKSGFQSFDEKVTIRGSDSTTAKKLLNSRKVRDNILKTFEMDESLSIGLNTVNADFVPQFKNGSYLGVYTINGWILEQEKIEKLFKIMDTIRKILAES